MKVESSSRASTCREKRAKTKKPSFKYRAQQYQSLKLKKPSEHDDDSVQLKYALY